jgi:hypothetical protein
MGGYPATVTADVFGVEAWNRYCCAHADATALARDAAGVGAAASAVAAAAAAAAALPAGLLGADGEVDANALVELCQARMQVRATVRATVRP